MTLMPRLLAALAIISVLTLATPTQAKPKCFPREGKCVLVTVNGQEAVELSKKDRRRLAERFDESPYADDATLQVPDAVTGELEVVGKHLAGSESWFGSGISADVGVVPLEQVQLEVSQRESVASSVRVGGEALRTQRLELQSNVLPAGTYLLRVTLRGSDNWDRATVLLRVE